MWCVRMSLWRSCEHDYRQMHFKFFTTRHMASDFTTAHMASDSGWNVCVYNMSALTSVCVPKFSLTERTCETQSFALAKRNQS